MTTYLKIYAYKLRAGDLVKGWGRCTGAYGISNENLIVAGFEGKNFANDFNPNPNHTFGAGETLEVVRAEDPDPVRDAAPDLLEALISILDGGIADPNEVTKAHAAIAKAKDGDA